MSMSVDESLAPSNAPDGGNHIVSEEIDFDVVETPRAEGAQAEGLPVVQGVHRDFQNAISLGRAIPLEFGDFLLKHESPPPSSSLRPGHNAS